MRHALFTASAALALAACVASKSAETAPAAAANSEALPFIEDDFPHAIALAKTNKLPVFVDVWAPW